MFFRTGADESQVGRPREKSWLWGLRGEAMGWMELDLAPALGERCGGGSSRRGQGNPNEEEEGLI